MADKSKIEWTDASWTPIRAMRIFDGAIGWHCEHATTGCEHCYAEGMNKRLGTGLPFKPGHRKDIDIFLDDDMLLAPLRWKKPRMVFVCSMTDLFADFVKDEWIDRIFAVMALCPQHTFQVLTKRAKRMREYIANCDMVEIARKYKARIFKMPAKWPLPNVWLGISAERQQEADERIPLLMQTPAAVRFVSAEPLLGPLTISYLEWAKLDWLIVGGESGKNARPMHPDWARFLRDQCKAAGVPFFFKQWGEWGPVERINVCKTHALCGMMAHEPKIERDWPKALDFLQKTRGLEGAHVLARVGKSQAGRLLDGQEHNEFPVIKAESEAA